jgi:hypothetical protein
MGFARARVVLALLAGLLAAACGAEESGDGGGGSGGEPAEPAPEPAIAPLAGELLIAELYYSGAVPRGGTDHYFSDQFVELVNASDHPLDLSGVMLGDAYGTAGPINPGTAPDSFRDSHPDQVVLSSLWRLPQGGRLEPGDRLVIAHDGTNHRPFSTIDLSGAGFETYVAGSGNDDDHPTVDNLEPVAFNGGADWLITVFGPSVVVLSADAPLGSEASPIGELATAPVASVLDAIETLMDGNAGAFKRLPDSVDRGHAWVSGTYVGESLHRRQVDGAFQDTGDSAADFEVGPPAPSIVVASEGVFGDPWIELGSGRAAFQPLVDGDSLELVAGIQGGWHLDASLRFGGFGPDGIELVYQALDDMAQPISFVTEASLSSASVLPDGDGWVRLGDRIVLDVIDPAPVVGKTAVVRVTAALDGQTWSDERSVVIVDDQ